MIELGYSAQFFDTDERYLTSVGLKAESEGAAKAEAEQTATQSMPEANKIKLLNGGSLVRTFVYRLEGDLATWS